MAKEMTMNVLKLPVHPAANLFPMLDKEEMENLVEDIKENGLQEPLVIGEHEGETVLVDGRNRREACKQAKIALAEIPVQQLNGHDPTAYIISANIMRRHLSKGQQAVLWAMVKPEGDQGKKTSTRYHVDVGKNSQVMARTVNREAPDLASAILSGTWTLPQAYDEVRARQKEAAGDTARMDRLKEERSDLAELVQIGKMTLSAAIAGAKEDDRIARENRMAEYNEFNRALILDKFRYVVQREGFLKELVPQELENVTGMSVTEVKRKLRSCRDSIEKLLEEWN